MVGVAHVLFVPVPNHLRELTVLCSMFPNLTDRAMLVVGAALCLIAAWCTIGYHHPDEHFQIWEFANYKLGRIPASELPWEFAEQMRPGLQPFIAYSIALFSMSIGWEDPFVQVFLARLLCAVAALWVYWAWTKWLVRDLASEHSLRWMRFGLLFFWLMPYLNVRFSSENTSAITFFGGLLLLMQANEGKSGQRAKWALSGVLLALSFFFRYQIAFAGLGLCAWLLLQARLGVSAWAYLIAGALAGFALGFWADHWLYGEWVLAPYHYFTSNIMEGKAAEFGVSPFWWYITEMPIALVPPLSLLLVALFAMGLWSKPKHVLAWCVVPFIIAHSAVGHKEVRFLFPMALPFFFFAVAGWEYFSERYETRRWMVGLFRLGVALNLLLLLPRQLVPAKEMAAYNRFLWQWEESHPNSSVYFVKKEPDEDDPLNMPFYKNPDQEQLSWYTDPVYRNDTTSLKEGDLMLFTEVRSPLPATPPGYDLERVFAYYPDWVLHFDFNEWQSRTRIWAIYRLTKRGADGHGS
jgi:phosphatidylinositol glycan class B